VLFAPGLRSASELETVIREVDRPVSVLGGFRGLHLSVAELGALGVRRVSVGGLLAHVAYGALIHAATELRSSGSFGFVSEVARARDLSALLADR
jgi:2-methylisocitrate lyase-like PEP mutase family enzyme